VGGLDLGVLFLQDRVNLGLLRVGQIEQRRELLQVSGVFRRGRGLGEQRTCP